MPEAILIRGSVLWMVRVCIALIACTLVAGVALGQEPAPKKDNLFRTVKPQVMVFIREHATGADLVDVSVTDSEYPPELLKAQAENIAKEIGSPLRGFRQTRETFGLPGKGSLQATFSVDGLIQPGETHLLPVVRAFLGAPKPFEITGLSVLLGEVRPTSSTLMAYRSPSVELQGYSDAGRIGTEYRVLIKDQNPANLDIPEKAGDVGGKVVPVVAKTGLDPMVLTLFIVAAIAAGALVYSLASRRPRSPR